MSQLNFRDTPPARTYTGKELKDYKRYKDALESDFNKRCGYSDCHHDWFGGKRNYQIDHFKPKSIYPKLETKYSNLVYACSYVNRAKSDDDGNYIDPCDINYNDHFYRDELGNIYPLENSEPAKYMYRKLKLYLKRYSIIWMLEQLEIKKEHLWQLIQEHGSEEAKDLYILIDRQYMNHKKQLTAVL
ncbi:MAG: hypothetical protein RIR12_1388 [Bacteroidota bacterium]|jgi:hypothetical protein